MGNNRPRRDRAALAPGQEFANRALAESGKGYTRADFRAKREALGVTVHDIARELGIEERTVNRWERGLLGKDAMPGDFAWRFLDAYEMAKEPAVQDIYDEAVGGRGSENEIILRYWRTQQEYSDATGDERSYTFRNACIRAAARRLREDGLAVALRFEREDDVEYVFDDDLSEG